MIFAVCTVGTVTAEGNLEVTYINADSTKIMIDFSHEVDVDELTDAITLFKDNAGKVQFEVQAKTSSTNGATRTAESNTDESDTTVSYGKSPAVYPLAMAANTNYSYVIVPTGGINDIIQRRRNNAPPYCL